MLQLIPGGLRSHAKFRMPLVLLQVCLQGVLLGVVVAGGESSFLAFAIEGAVGFMWHVRKHLAVSIDGQVFGCKLPISELLGHEWS